MTEAQIIAEMRIRALEGLITTLLAAYCLQVAPADPVDGFSKMREKLAATTQSWVFPDLDPAMSDHYAAELTAALNRLLDFFIATDRDNAKRSKGATLIIFYSLPW